MERRDKCVMNDKKEPHVRGRHQKSHETSFVSSPQDDYEDNAKCSLSSLLFGGVLREFKTRKTAETLFGRLINKHLKYAKETMSISRYVWYT
jgi:hypothetical protein